MKFLHKTTWAAVELSLFCTFNPLKFIDTGCTCAAPLQDTKGYSLCDDDDDDVHAKLGNPPSKNVLN